MTWLANKLEVCKKKVDIKGPLWPDVTLWRIRHRPRVKSGCRIKPSMTALGLSLIYIEHKEQKKTV